MSLELSVTT